MPSSNQTSVYGLNQWVGTDKPKREDFNTDNALLEAALNSLASSTTPTMSYTPALSGTTTAGNFNYTRRSGEYKLIGDTAFVRGWIAISNFLSAGTAGSLQLSMPAPLAGHDAPMPIRHLFSTGLQNVMNYLLTPSGFVQIEYSTLAYGNLTAEHITSDGFTLQFALWYRYK